MANRKLTVEIIGDSRSLERAFGKATKSGRGFGRSMATLGKVAAVGLGGGFVVAGLAMRRGFQELAESQKVMAQTQAVIKSTGGAANVTAKHVDKLATSLARKSGVDDESIAASENMLLTFTNIRNGVGKNNKIFDQAASTVLDLAVAMGRDPVDAAIMVGKALNDTELNAKGTITGWSALRRVGVKVSADMMKQAAAFIKAGKPMEAQKLLLRELNTEFGGSAAAFGGTLPGAMGRFNMAIDDVMGAFVKGFLPIILKVTGILQTKLANPAFIARVERLGTLIGTKLYDAFVSISGWFKQHWPQIQEGFRVGSMWLLRMSRFAKSTFSWLSKIANLAPGEGVAKLAGLLGIALGAKGLGGKGGKGKGGGKGGLLKGGLLAAGARVAAPAIATGLAVGAAGNKLDPGRKVPGLAEIIRRFREIFIPQGTWRTAFAHLPKKFRPGVRAAFPELFNRNRGLRAYPRARGGPISPGGIYRVGERGPETIVSGMRGTVIPNGAGGLTLVSGDVFLDGQKVGHLVLNSGKRRANSTPPSRRGRHGGSTNVALG